MPTSNQFGSVIVPCGFLIDGLREVSHPYISDRGSSLIEWKYSMSR